jgi:hypothetical protein
VVGEGVNRMMGLRELISWGRSLMGMRRLRKILIVLELGGLMVEMEAMEEFKIQKMIVRFSANKYSQKPIILEKKQHLRDLVEQAATFSNKKAEKVEALSG